MAKGNKPSHEVFGVIERTATQTSDGGTQKRSYWTRIGVGFQNSDGSVNLMMDYLPNNSNVRLQLRPAKRSSEEVGNLPELPFEDNE